MAAEKDIGHECLARMQALLYVFAGKFLNKDDLQKVKGAISMTILGEMLVKDGLDPGGFVAGHPTGNQTGRREARTSDSASDSKFPF